MYISNDQCLYSKTGSRVAIFMNSNYIYWNTILSNFTIYHLFIYNDHYQYSKTVSIVYRSSKQLSYALKVWIFKLYDESFQYLQCQYHYSASGLYVSHRNKQS